MDRAERGRQQKIAAKKAKLGQSDSPFPGQDESTIQQALDLALSHHTAGRLSEAGTIYQQILQTSPEQPVAMHLLGVVAHQGGKIDIAVDLITKAIAIKPDFAEAHNNLGNALKELGKLDDAVASYHKALAINPKFAGAHNNLGSALQELGTLDEAVASYNKALAIMPDYAEAHYNLSIALQDLGKLDEAVAGYRQAVAIKPDYTKAHNNLGYALNELGEPGEALESFHKALAIAPEFAEAHSNLGIALKDLGRPDEAVASYRKALAIKPDYAEAHNNLGLVLLDLEKPDKAVTSLRHAVALNPRNDVFWDGLAASLESYSFTSVDDNIWPDLLQVLERPTVSPSNLIRPIISALRCHPDFTRILELTIVGRPDTGMAYGNVAGQLSSIPVFLRILGLSPIRDLEIETMLTVLRRAMLADAVAGKTDEKGLAFSAALALQCFTNEYVFSETDEEKADVEHLQQQIATLIDQERDVPPSLVATLGAYRPLYPFPWARELCEREWGGHIKDVVERQISEPQEELSLRDQIPRLTAIRNTVSHSVREQYEENPYPRWIKTGIMDKGKAIGAVLQGAPLNLDLGDYVSPENPEILVAGCGTGRQAVNTVSRFSNPRVLAVDLSLSSLCYAMRKTHELGYSNIEYSQADIMELGDCGRQFDLIECGGVLHHLDDPLAGWRVLVDLLRPGGLMMIGLYSETARQDIIDGQTLIAEKGYTTSPEDIRQCRQDIKSMAEAGNRKMAELCNTRDFFSISECRDLLFHVQEHRFTLPQIEAALTSLKLKFLDFEMRDQRVLRAFRKTHSGGEGLTSFPLWHEFELMNPDTFRGMYQFWCQKI